MDLMKSTTIFSLCSLVAVLSCPELCSDSDLACSRECMIPSCSEWRHCAIFERCSDDCTSLLGNGICNLECFTEECAWDGFECEAECSVGCKTSDLRNGLCDEACNTQQCNWDYGDCTSRFLSSPDCTGVSASNPFQVFVSDNVPSSTQFPNIVQALINGVYCSYNEIILLKNTEVTSELGSTLAVGGAGSVSILVTSINAEVFTVFVQQSVQIQVQGSLIFSNIIFEGGQIENESNSFFTVGNNAVLAFAEVTFQGYLNEIVRIDYGTLSVSGSSFSGSVSGSSVFSTTQCEIFCEINFSNTEFANINFNDSQLLVAQSTRVSVSNSRFTNALSNSILFTLLHCEINLESLSMSSSNIFGLMLISRAPVFKMQDSYFSDIILERNLLEFKYTENCNFVNSTFLEVSGQNFIIELKATIASIYSSLFSNCNASAIFSDSDSSLGVYYSEISNSFAGTNPKISGIYSRNSLLEVGNTKFLGQNSAITIEGFSDSGINLIKNSWFENCTSSSGGAVSVLNANISISSNVFNSNKATHGGALYIRTSLQEQFNISVQFNSFTNNQAQGGGGVFWESSVVGLSTNIFINNTANYGSDQATPGTNLMISKELKQMQPGNPVTECLEFLLKDYYNQTVTDNSTVLAGLSLVSSNKNSFLSGNFFLTPVDGVYSFCNFVIYATPDSEETLRATIYGAHTLLQVPYIDMPIYILPCSPGEVTTESLNSCQPCLSGQYTFSNNETKCNSCPANANCMGNTITPFQGYWHANETSVDIYLCINPDICVNDDNGACLDGYTGNLCAVCADGYTGSSSNTCEKCPSLTSNLILIGFLLTIIILFVCYTIYRTYEDAYELKLYHSVLLKILTNYLQLMIITTVLKMKWPEPFYQLITVQERIGSSTGKIFSLDCLIQMNSSVKPYYVSILINFLAPLVIGVLVLIVWGIVALVKNSIYEVIKPFTTSLVVIFFLMHPGISNTSLSILSCYQIQSGEYWNIYSFDIQCYTEEYQRDYYAIFILGILLWTIGMPALAYTLIRMNKNELELTGTKAKYGFLYHGYHGNRYYWEFVIMGRKLLIISVALLLRSSTVSMQLIFVLLILVCALVLNQHYKPFELEELNKTENYSIGLSITCFTSGLMVEAESAYAWHIILFTILVIGNTLFFFYFAKRVYQAIGHYLWSTCPHVARTLCPKAPRPPIKIKEILTKEKRKHSGKNKNYEVVSGFVDNNREVVLQLCNMRNYVDFYNEVLAARFNPENLQEMERRENELAARETFSRNEGTDNTVPAVESRPFLQRLFRRGVRRETVQDKINNIRKRTLIEMRQQDDFEGGGSGGGASPQN